jgi:hypothetical protein
VLRVWMGPSMLQHGDSSPSMCLDVILSGQLLVVQTGLNSRTEFNSMLAGHRLEYLSSLATVV